MGNNLPKDQGDNPQPENTGDDLQPELILKIRDYITSYLKGWMALFGIANIAALGAALIYIFFILPDTAIEKASSTINQRSITAISAINEELKDVLKEFGRADERNEQLQKNAKKVFDQIDEIQKQSEQLAKRNENLLKETDKLNIEVKANKDRLTKVDKIITSIEKLDFKTIEQKIRLITGAPDAEKILIAVKSIEPLKEEMEKKIEKQEISIIEMNKTLSKLNTEDSGQSAQLKDIGNNLKSIATTYVELKKFNKFETEVKGLIHELDDKLKKANDEIEAFKKIHKVTFDVKNRQANYSNTDDLLTIAFSNKDPEKVGLADFHKSIIQEFSFSGLDVEDGKQFSFTREVRDLHFLDSKYILLLNHGIDGWDVDAIRLTVDKEIRINKSGIQPNRGPNKHKDAIQNFNKRFWSSRSYWLAGMK